MVLHSRVRPPPLSDISWYRRFRTITALWQGLHRRCFFAYEAVSATTIKGNAEEEKEKEKYMRLYSQTTGFPVLITPPFNFAGVQQALQRVCVLCRAKRIRVFLRKRLASPRRKEEGR